MKNNTSHILRGITLATLIVALAGCASTRNAAPQEVYLYGGAPNLDYPRDNQPDSAHRYAHGLWEKGEYEEAALWFDRAANVRTESREWEFENLLNATVAWLEAGDANRARQLLERALALRVHAPPSERARYLQALLLGENANALSPKLKATLPRT